jgi:hypothetical protein
MAPRPMTPHALTRLLAHIVKWLQHNKMALYRFLMSG